MNFNFLDKHQDILTQSLRTFAFEEPEAFVDICSRLNAKDILLFIRRNRFILNDTQTKAGAIMRFGYHKPVDMYLTAEGIDMSYSSFRPIQTAYLDLDFEDCLSVLAYKEEIAKEAEIEQIRNRSEETLFAELRRLIPNE